MTVSLRGHILVASPKLTDPNFFRTVVLMVQHDEEGAVGVVLNRRVQNKLAEVWEALGDGACPLDTHLQWGGPVGNALLALHQQQTLSDGIVLPSLFVSSDKPQLVQLIEQATKPLRFYLGYSGWGAGQLEDELRQGGWLIATAVAEMPFYEGEDLWEQAIDRIGQQILRPALGAAPSPDDPRVN